jgi:murein DD-endopeptidase MepM/ murein hydrolase activator NlpD
MPSDFEITPASVWTSGEVPTSPVVNVTPTLYYSLPPVRQPGDPIVFPTPDDPHYLTVGPRGSEQYIVQRGDILSAIAERYNVSVEAIVEANNLTNPDALEVGQQLTIPATDPQSVGPDDKIIPDSELVYGPLSTSTDIAAYIQSKGGYLATYTQDVYGETLTGAEVVLQIAQAYSISPRLLLALLEYSSGWLTNPDPDETSNPFGYVDDWYTGLYRQLAWASVHLNSGYYRWRAGLVTDWLLLDGSVVPIAPTINAGTAGVQNFFAKVDDYESWLADVSPGGFYDGYYILFGNSFDYAIDPLVPLHVFQPFMHLPFGEGEIWSFTGGPHLAWDAGTPFGAIDFAPPGEALGCVVVDDWVTAVADGLVIRTGDGVVMLDLDLDGNEGTGWVVLYMHIESRDRVQPGVFLRAGEPVGHPSCEGGLSSGTHVHLARKLNGEWIAADGDVPFILDGWISAGTGEEYVGTLTRNGVVVEAFEGNSTVNLIQR